MAVCVPALRCVCRPYAACRRTAVVLKRHGRLSGLQVTEAEYREYVDMRNKADPYERDMYVRICRLVARLLPASLRPLCCPPATLFHARVCSPLLALTLALTHVACGAQILPELQDPRSASLQHL